MITIKISGPAASGKTTTANTIAAHLEELWDKKVVIYDDFQGPDKFLKEESAERIAASGAVDVMIFVGENI